MKESGIEKVIQMHIKSKGGWSQRLHSGQIVTKYGDKSYAMHLAEKGSPDLIACVKGQFYGIEVKADEEIKEKWMKLFKRVQQGEELPKSYHREKAQIDQCNKIINAGGKFILASSVDDVKEVI